MDETDKGIPGRARRAGPAAKRRRGFTLIELMVVMVVIALLAAMVFRMIGNISTSNKISQTKAILERVAMALEAYKGIYGKYPPVPHYGNDYGQPVRYECPAIDMSVYGDIYNESVDDELVRIDGHRNSQGEFDQEIRWQDARGEGTGIFTFGLCSFFLPRYQLASSGGNAWFGLKNAGNARVEGDDDAARFGEEFDENGNYHPEYHQFRQWKLFNKRRADSKPGDSLRDLNAARKILPYLGARLTADGKVDLDGSIFTACPSGERLDIRKVYSKDGSLLARVTIAQWTIKDAWGEGNSEIGHYDLRYISRPPYETYDLRSAGPDERFDTDDDIVVGKTHD